MNNPNNPSSNSINTNNNTLTETINPSTKQAREYRTFSGDKHGVRMYTLPNGLTVYLAASSEKPEVKTSIVVKAGSYNDPSETTGLAHYLEHLMFKGTSKIGTIDYESEKPYLDEIENLFEEYGKQTDENLRKAIYSRIDSLSYEASQYSVANEYDTVYDELGISGLNAYTSFDRTCFVSTVPSGEIERWAIMESQRFLDPVFRGFHTELETVYEEYNRSSTGAKTLRGIVNTELFPEIKYRQHDVIGYPSHLKNPSIKNIKSFFDTYYCANNMAIIMCGDLDYDKAMDIIEKYFGNLKSNPNLPAFEFSDAAPLTECKSATMTDPESPSVYLLWRMPGRKLSTASQKEDLKRMACVNLVLNNPDFGLLNVNLARPGKALGPKMFSIPLPDHALVGLTAKIKEGQSADEVKELLLAEIDKLKRGEFIEEIVTASKNYYQQATEASDQDNAHLVTELTTAFVTGEDYEDLYVSMEKLKKVTKEDIVALANRYFTDCYLTIYKNQGESTAPKIEKPHITPIHALSDVHSDFCQDLLSMPTVSSEPVYLDYDKDLSRIDVCPGAELLYCQNKKNHLFSFNIIINESGECQYPALNVLSPYLDRVGTPSMTADQIHHELSVLASFMGMQVSFHSSAISIFGLQENFEKTFTILKDVLYNTLADDVVCKDVCDIYFEDYESAKDQFSSCVSYVKDYCIYGGDDLVKARTFTHEMANGLTGQGMLDLLREIFSNPVTFGYWGPDSEELILEKVNELKGLLHYEDKDPNQYIPKGTVVQQPEVFLYDYDNPSARVVLHACWGEKFKTGEEALYPLFNSYFRRVAQREIRESRSLSYEVSAYYDRPDKNWDYVKFSASALTQTDKIKQCIEAFDDIIKDVPYSDVLLETVKDHIVSLNSNERIDPMYIIDRFSVDRDLGYDHDRRKDVIEQMPDKTFEDMIDFHRRHLGDHPFRYIVIGRVKDMDMDYLKTLGPVTILTEKNVFGL